MIWKGVTDRRELIAYFLFAFSQVYTKNISGCFSVDHGLDFLDRLCEDSFHFNPLGSDYKNDW